MKYLVNVLRVLVGLLFIFSGLIKANDPTGFSIKLDEYFSVFSADLEDARVYEEAAAIGQSSKGGIMGFVESITAFVLR